MKKQKRQAKISVDTGSPDSEQTQRIVFFDLLRIFCVAAIVYIHLRYPYVPPWFNINKIFFSDGYFFNIYPNSLSGIGVYGMIFISGAVIQYKYKEIRSFSEYLSFMIKRFIRIYPAFWLSLITAIICFPILLVTTPVPSIILQFTGFYIFLGIGPDTLNLMGWFIGTIMVLYLLFPMFSQILKKYQFAALLAITFISLATRYYLITYHPIPMYNIFYWLPICNMFEFCLGIYLVQHALYLKNHSDHPTIEKLSDLSFYVFLFHVVLIKKLAESFPQSPVPNTEAIFYFVVMGIVVAISWMAMLVDKRIQRYLLQSRWIQKVLTPAQGLSEKKTG